MRKTRVALFSLLVIFIALQFFPAKKNISTEKSPPTDISSVYHIPENVQHILAAACYDCHSNNTRYPWYTNLQPIGWWMAAHISEGRQELNFNEYGSYSIKRQKNKMKRMKEQLLTGQMPLSSYKLMHPEARLTQEQLRLLANWIDSTLLPSAENSIPL